jgi:hypothetical protein
MENPVVNDFFRMTSNELNNYVVDLEDYIGQLEREKDGLNRYIDELEEQRVNGVEYP